MGDFLEQTAGGVLCLCGWFCLGFFPSNGMFETSRLEQLTFLLQRMLSRSISWSANSKEPNEQSRAVDKYGDFAESTIVTDGRP